MKGKTEMKVSVLHQDGSGACVDGPGANGSRRQLYIQLNKGKRRVQVH